MSPRHFSLTNLSTVRGSASRIPLAITNTLAGPQPPLLINERMNEIFPRWHKCAKLIFFVRSALPFLRAAGNSLWWQTATFPVLSGQSSSDLLEVANFFVVSWSNRATAVIPHLPFYWISNFPNRGRFLIARVQVKRTGIQFFQSFFYFSDRSLHRIVLESCYGFLIPKLLNRIIENVLSERFAKDFSLNVKWAR